MRGLDHDRTQALSMIAPHRAIESRSIEAYWDRLADTPGSALPARLRDEADEVRGGKVVLVLPDGSRWVHVNALLRRDPDHGNQYIQRLLQLLRAHMARRGHVPTSGVVTDFSLQAASLNLRDVFCHQCIRCIDLEDDAGEVDVARPSNDA
jgi:hypothetical protein